LRTWAAAVSSKAHEKLLEWPYIIVYRVDVDAQEVIILSIVHGARNRIDPD